MLLISLRVVFGGFKVNLACLVHLLTNTFSWNTFILVLLDKCIYIPRLNLKNNEIN